MKPKKNPKADLTKKRLLFFQISLIFVLFASWQAMELKTYASNELVSLPVDTDFLAETDVPIVLLPKSEPLIKSPSLPDPLVKDPTRFKVIDNHSKEESPLIKFKKPDDPIVTVASIPTIPTDDPVEQISFVLVEQVPVFPGCDKLSNNEERKQCMEKKIKEIVRENFDTDFAQDLGLSGVNRIQVLFKIDSKGNVVDVKARAPHPRLQQEAVRVINSLPDMEPGKQRGKAVEVLYSLPIIFQVQ